MQQLKNLTKKLKPLLKKYKLNDIVIFGSFVRGKFNPNDLDIALIVKNENKELIFNAENEIKSICEKSDIIILNFDEIYEPLFASIFKEGFSILKEEFFYNLHGVEPLKLYKYSIKFLNPVQKVQFERGLNKIIKSINGVKIVRSVVLVPLNLSEEFEEFLKTWKIHFETERYELIKERRKIKF